MRNDTTARTGPAEASDRPASACAESRAVRRPAVALPGRRDDAGEGGPQPPRGGGLNAGEPIEEGGDLFGTTLQLAARITDRAEPGQILVGNVVRELCAGKRPEFESRGAAALKGFDEPATVFEVIGFEVIGFEVIGLEVAD